MQYDDQKTEYVPGTCNIGPQEIARRYRTAVAGLVLSVLFIMIVEASDVPGSMRLLIFFPALLITSGIIQAMYRFCLAYGWRGVFSVKEYRTPQRITDPAYLRADRKMAVRQAIRVVLAASGIAVCYYLLAKLVEAG